MKVVFKLNELAGDDLLKILNLKEIDLIIFIDYFIYFFLCWIFVHYKTIVKSKIFIFN